MNRKLFASTLLAAALGLTACADATAPTSIDAAAARSGGTATAGQGGTVSSSVTVAGQFQVDYGTTEQIVGFRTTPHPIQAGGECGTDERGQPDGTWTKITKGTTAIHLLHDHCTIRVQVPNVITVSFSEPATYVVTPAGNIQLNLAPLCVDEVCTARSIHYRANQDATAGSGVVVGVGSDGSSWTIDLAQIAHGGSVRPEIPDGIAAPYRAYGSLVATRVGGSESVSTASLGW